MQLRKELASPLTARRKAQIADSILNRRILLDEVVSAFLGEDYRTTQNAAWILGTLASLDASLLTPHLSTFIRRAAQPGASDSIKRNVMRLLQFTPLPEKLHDGIASLAYKFFENRNEAVAIRVFAMTVLTRLAEIYPDIKRTLKQQITDELPYGSAGFVSRGKAMLKKLG